ncbi:MAG TPA: TonB-dependent receptor plug domain-containing protein [Bacteroidales bacterium]|nr:TonB-dependent receptor plug domain-containing protein [Bacteroidales bacterium]
MRKKLLILLGALAFGQITHAQTDTTVLVNQGALPVITLTDSDLDGGRAANDISGLLQSSRDIFVSTAGFNFGSVRFRMRGLDSENTTVLFNGVSMNDLETGRASYSTWGGLNDATRFTEVSNGIGSSDWAFGGIGGVTNILSRASQFRKAFNVSYAASNRSYNNRIMMLYATGMQQNGWAVTLSGSRRWAVNGYVPGTFYDAWSWFGSVEKKINDRHSLGLIAFAAPTKRGMAAVSVQEAYDLSGTNFYNANWGYQNGEIRNARVSRYNQPVIQLSHYWTPNTKTSLQTTAFSWFGPGGSTALDWNEANDPRPDYYRNLPSYWMQRSDETNYAYYLDQWTNNEQFRQLQWDHFFFANSKNLFTVNNANGIAGNRVTGNKSKFIVEDRRMDRNMLGININAQHQLNASTRFSGGLNYTRSKTRHHKRIEDLLGGDFWLDIDKYSDQEPFSITDASQNDLRNPNRIVKEGDIFGYDYLANVNTAELWAQAEKQFSRLETYLGAKISTTDIWRTGKMQNGRFPDNSYGDDAKINFVNYGFKAGATYAIDGRNYLMANASILTRPPYFRDIYLSPRTRDTKVSNIQDQNVLGADLNYILRAPNLKARLTVYHTEIRNDLWTRSYYHEDLRAFVNYAMTDVDTRSQGVEFGAEINLSPTLSAHAVAGHGMYIFTNRPNVTISADNDAKLLAENRMVYLKNYYVGGSPQTIYSAGLRYNSPKFWFAGLSANYFDNAYLEPNPDNHTKEAMSRYAEGDIRIDKLLVQKKLDPGLTLDFFGGKSWRVSDGLLLLNVSINNILNQKDIVSWGFEQLRTDLRDPDRFPAKYAYMYGTTYFISLTYRKN